MLQAVNAPTKLTFVDLKIVWRAKPTYSSALYWHHDEMVLLKAQGVKLSSGTDPVKLPLYTQLMMADTMIAKKRLEKTQKVADGNLPDGFKGVAIKVLSIISSCIIPHILIYNLEF